VDFFLVAGFGKPNAYEMNEHLSDIGYLFFAMQAASNDTKTKHAICVRFIGF